MTIFNREDSRTVLPQLEKSIKGVNQRIDGLLDFFYPVGSYYETSDVEFDPNKAWGGVWVKETAGQVHVSAGTGYTINGALTNTSDGGSKDAIIVSHTHRLSSGWSSSAGTDRITFGQVSGAYQNAGSGNLQFVENTGSSGTGKNMPPYIAVNRWHRIK